MGLAALLSLPLTVHGAEAPIHLYGNSGIVNMYDHMGVCCVYVSKFGPYGGRGPGYRVYFLC